ncbi:MAG TPA: DUF1800 family protein [Solirubrobacteraceae bacterium]
MLPIRISTMGAAKTSSGRKPARKKVCKRVRVKGTKRSKMVCKPKKQVVKRKAVKKPAGATKPVLMPVAGPVAGGPVFVSSPAGGPVTTPAAPGPAPPQDPPTAPNLPVYDGAFGVREAQRLLWRAGFGPGAGQPEQLAQQGLLKAVRSLTRPSGEATLVGSAPTVDGAPLAPEDAWGHEHLWWLDRMIRSDQPLVERMTLIWHDWFANSNGDVDNRKLMLSQNALMRSRALGSFAELATDLAADPAMLLFLSGIDNRRDAPNENYARELMELFTLGADRGAYTEQDVRSLARCFTGWRASWSEELGFHNFRFDGARFDSTSKTLWAGTPHQRSGNFGWRDAVALCLENPYHRSFFVLKLWSYFVPSAPSASTQAALEALYVASGHSIGQVVEAILLHPDVYQGGPLVKPPVVYNAGLLRALGQTITDDSWSWRSELAGQKLFYPPNVSGWNDRAWLDTSRLYGRWYIARRVFAPVLCTAATYNGSTETGAQALAAALELLGQPSLAPESRAALLAFAEQPAPIGFSVNEYRAQRQNALRQLIATSPDMQVC